jgi:hypothetical protein
MDSMNKQKLSIWGREFELEVVFERYAGEEILPFQRDALTGFLSASERLLDSAKQSVEEYCVKRDKDEIGSSKIGRAHV